MALQWGLFGASRIARSLIPAIRAAGGHVAMVGVREPQSARAKAFAQEWDIARIGSYQDVTESEVDAVYNPLPNDEHLPWSAAAMRAGKHVLTEKPLSMNAAEAQTFADIAQETGRTSLEAFAYRFTPQIEELQRLVQAGDLGDLRSVRGGMGFSLQNEGDFRWMPEKGGGALYDVGCYPVDLTRLLLGMPEAISGQARMTAGGVDIAFSGTLAYPEALASFDCGFDWCTPMTAGVQVVGTGGVLTLEAAYDSSAHSHQIELNGQTRAVTPDNGYTRMVAHFQRAAQGEEALRYTPQDSVTQARILDALFRSAREGQRVQK
ncbi:Gfo/Idh/MocA family oxidoreductase [Deinococcus sp. KNUC1210]|uniref:Gfo/Idh/MocA family protein n=1 Tax=Deinococcus sp. KNUC1210 TaxID=2917691 RepID=UPI001EEFBA6D|nr:Gfo/Idh/MocA family oxidoreductase [Deinococcus sp. KNUC1210]ULH15640.1 Gfo/Idh/MocA family oxidoreductase [Deinococcus sp. KNUC1210]